MDQALKALPSDRPAAVPSTPRASRLTLRVPPLTAARCPQLDELKGLAILLVVIYHAGGVMGWNNYIHGDLGVDIFVILSGVGLTLSAAPVTGIWPFMARRLRRIMPAYWVVLTALLLAHALVFNIHYSATDIILHYLGVHGWFGEIHLGSICDTFWLARLALDEDQLLLLGGALALTLAFAYFFTGRAGSFGLIALRFPGFFVGLLLGRLLRTGHLELTLGPLLGLAGFVLGYLPYTQGIVFHSVPVALTLMGFYVFFFRSLLLKVVPLATTIMAVLGVHSLELYLLHAPLMREFNFYRLQLGVRAPVQANTTQVLAMAVGLALAVVAAIELRRALGRLVRT